MLIKIIIVKYKYYRCSVARNQYWPKAPKKYCNKSISLLFIVSIIIECSLHKLDTDFW